ncbi:MAG: flagellar protein FlgN [Methylocystaceae bacterium]
MDYTRAIQLLTWMENVINEQNQVIARLLEMTNSKRRAIIADDIPVLQQVSAEEEKLLARLQELESVRIRVGVELAEATGHSEPIKAEVMQTLAAQLELDLAARLSTIIEQFTSNYIRLMEANQQNTELLHDALNYIDSVIMVISGGAEGVTYSSQGEIGDTTMRRYLNKKV